MIRVLAVSTGADRDAAFAIRRAVFIEEQSIPEAEEWDDADGTAVHFLALDNEAPAGTARLVPVDGIAKIGRVAVLREWRGTGLGRRIMEHALDHARRAGFPAAKLDAQVYAIPFYERLGFIAEGPEFDDGSGILHRHMTRQLDDGIANHGAAEA